MYSHDKAEARPLATKVVKLIVPGSGVLVLNGFCGLYSKNALCL